MLIIRNKITSDELKKIDEMIEFDSMINLRPSQGNRSRGVDDFNMRKRIIDVVNKLAQI